MEGDEGSFACELSNEKYRKALDTRVARHGRSVKDEWNSSSAEEGSMPTGDTDDSSGTGLDNEKKEVEEGPPPPPEGTCVQIAVDATPPGPPGRVSESEGLSVIGGVDLHPHRDSVVPTVGCSVHLNMKLSLSQGFSPLLAHCRPLLALPHLTPPYMYICIYTGCFVG